MFKYPYSNGQDGSTASLLSVSSRESVEFKVPTPVKELIGARRPRELTKTTVSKNLFEDGAEPRRSGRAGSRAEIELEQTTEKVKKLTPEELKARLGKTLLKNK